MSRNRQTGLVASAAVFSALSLAACGLGESPDATGGGNGGGGADGDQEVSGEIAGEITFQTMQLSPTFDDFINGMIEEFESEYPDVTVEWVDVPSDGTAQKIAADSASGNLADVLDLDTATLAPLARDGRVLDMAEVAADSEDLYTESSWDTFAYGDLEASALPWYLNTPVLITNTAIMSEAGIDLSEAPENYDELLEQSEQIANATGTAGFQPTVRGILDMMTAFGVPLVNEEGTEAVIDTPEALELIERLQGLYESGGIPADSITAGSRTEIETFSEGETAYLHSGGSRLTIIEENAPDLYQDVAVSQPLVGPDSGAWLVAHGLAVPTTSENQATAIEFALHVSNAENQLALAEQSSVFPSNGEALEDPFFSEPGEDNVTQARAIAAESLTSGRATADRHEAVDTQYEEELWSQLQLALMGDEDPAEALARAEESLTQMLQERSQ